MEITYNGRKLELSFGFKALNAIDRKLGVEAEQMKFGMGLQSTIPFVLQGDPITLGEYIIAMTSHHKKHPTENDVLDVLDDIAENQGLVEFAEELVETLGKRPSTQSLVPDRFKPAKKDNKKK